MKESSGVTLILASGVLFSLFALYGFWTFIYGPANPHGQPVNFEIHHGESLRAVGQRLAEEGIIKNKDIFVVLGVSTGLDTQLHEGKYLLSPKETVIGIVKALERGDEKPAGALTIKGGETLANIQETLHRDFDLEGNLDQIKIGDWQQEFPLLDDAPEKASLEGYLFPDTYFFSQSATVEDVVRKILFHFTEEMNSLSLGRKDKVSVYRTLILASLLEKEVIGLDDKQLVAGIIEKRIKIGMPIQIDATIHYILKKTSPLSINDTKVDSLYNTYQHLGLPPGPICNPGLESIQAALTPKDSSYLYYLTTPQGKVIYSRTLAEHNRAKAKYYPKK